MFIDVTHIFHCNVRVIALCLWSEKSKFVILEKRRAR